MRKINDTKLYFYFSIISAGLALVLGLVAAYSLVLVEPRIQERLGAANDIARNYKEAYVMLRDPQIFARYENFDGMSLGIKGVLKEFDDRMVKDGEFGIRDALYLEILLERRELGSRLTRNTAIFFGLLSLLGWGFFFYERRKAGPAVREG
ncbi:MAG: hypothetical protein EPN93_11975 [Spirochaetes bacterium]|nr:MAG: hypothetical protein EPN93_11975 [Spirochaetota bacterium]